MCIANDLVLAHLMILVAYSICRREDVFGRLVCNDGWTKASMELLYHWFNPGTATNVVMITMGCL